jgi:hypothetical protein
VALSEVQFRLRSLFIGTACCALAFGAFRWLGLTPRTSLFVSILATACFAAALILVAVIAKTSSDDDPS